MADFAMASGLDLDALEETARAAASMAPGPWFWRGNTDYEEPSMSCIVPSLGRVEVLGHCPVDRVRDSFEAREYMRGYRDCYMVTDEEAEEELERWLWADKAYEVANTDSRLTVTNERNVKQPVRDLVVYEVARHRGLPDSTPRTHGGIHRGNIIDVRSPIAQHLAAASADTVLALIARIRDLEAQAHRVTKAAAHLDDVVENTFGGGPTDEDYIREEERLGSLSFASGLVKAALNGVEPAEYLGSDQADKDIRRPSRCYLFGDTLPGSEPTKHDSRAEDAR